jgi:hypothetical protein
MGLLVGFVNVILHYRFADGLWKDLGKAYERNVIDRTMVDPVKAQQRRQFTYDVTLES